MKYEPTNSLLRYPARLLVAVLVAAPVLLLAQYGFSPTDAQRNALNMVRTQVNWLQNATRTAPNAAGGQGYDSVRQQFDALRAAYNGLKQTLSQRQLSYGGNDLADLDAGLDIIQEAFGIYEEDVTAGRRADTALRDLCQVMRQASAVWLQEFNKKASRLRIGLG